MLLADRHHRQLVERDLEARMAVGQPLVLGLQRRAELDELLVGREEPLPHDGRRRHREVLAVEQLRVEQRLLGGDVARVGRRQAEDMLRRQLVEHGLQQRAPQRQQVMALVEHDDAHARVAQRSHPRSRRSRQQLVGRQVGQLARRDLPLDPRDQPRDVALALRRGLPLPARRLGHDLLDGLPGDARTLACPNTESRLAQHPLGVGGPAQRLVGQRMQVLAHRPEQRLLLRPLALDRARRAQHDRRHAEAPHDLQPDDRLARPRRRDEQRLVAPGGAVGFEGRPGTATDSPATAP